MQPTEIRGLAKAICAWLAYKQITGFEGALGEAMLAIPISEYLKTRTNWKLQSEVLYEHFGLPEAPQFSCDFAGMPTYGEHFRFLLEAKYLKEKAQSRARDIAADLIRLSLPSIEGLRRYFLLAGDAIHFPSNEDEFLFGHNLFKLEQGEGRYFKPKEEVQNESFRRKYPLLSQQTDHLLPYAYIQYGANEKFPTGDKSWFQVMIWSVGRSKRDADDGVAAQQV